VALRFSIWRSLACLLIFVVPGVLLVSYMACGETSGLSMVSSVADVVDRDQSSAPVDRSVKMTGLCPLAQTRPLPATTSLCRREVN
jgi:hypothetical protein